MGDNRAHPFYYLRMRIAGSHIHRIILVVTVSLIMCSMAATVSGAELHAPLVAGAHGDVVKLAVTVDKVDNLAGIKLSLTYDTNILKFIKADKTTYTANMLHVVNDKVPGRLIVVMASARGFAGENVPLVDLTFELLKDVKKEDNITLQIIEAELMGDDLKRIEITSH